MARTPEVQVCNIQVCECPNISLTYCKSHEHCTTFWTCMMTVEHTCYFQFSFNLTHSTSFVLDGLITVLILLTDTGTIGKEAHWVILS